MDDAAVIDLFLRRDEEAVKTVAEKYGARLRELAYGITNDRATAEECENDAYLAAWDSIPPHEPRDHLYAYLARITRHIALNRCRYDARLKRSAYICELSDELEQCIPASGGVESSVDDILLREAINGFLKKLDKEKRDIFIRRYWYLDPVSSISKRFAVSESKVKTTLFRCREKLRKYLEKEGFTV